MPTNISIPGFTPATDDLFVYSQQGGVAQPGATTMAQFQAFVRNNSDVLKCLVQRLWQPQVQYSANHVVWSPNMAPNLQAKVKTAGTTSGVEPVWSELVGAEVTDGTVVYTMEEIVPTLPTVVSSVTELNGLITVQFTNETQKTFQLVKTVNGVAPSAADGNVTLPVEGVLVGDVMYRAYLADGYVKANGATVSRSDYPTLVAYATEHSLWTDSPATEPWKYGNGDGNTTMVLPDYRGRFIQGGDNTAVLSAGLPNILGSVHGGAGDALVVPTSGAMQLKSASAAWNFTSADSLSTNRLLQFDASLSNEIYGKSDTVTPPSLVMIPQIKY